MLRLTRVLRHVEAHEGIKKANAIGKNLCTVHGKKFEILMQIPLVGGEIERSWSPDTILKVYYPRTIHAMFALNWLTGFRREDF
jgi:hypothetical protein